MQCKQYQQLIYREIDGCISPEEKGILTEHLLICPACTRDKTEILSLHQVIHYNISDVKVPDLSSAFDRNFYIKLHTEKKDSLRLGEYLSQIKMPTLKIAVVAVILLLALINIPKLNRFIPIPKSTGNFTSTNSSIIYNVVLSKTEQEELKSVANKQTKELLAQLGFCG